ncbi:hypothetical protein I7I51_08558 [Histoplasma capsulatum]|uniref:Uncharacterized protein n=1 Tax=Ajellomyces capsulatus TaxID=5037 RepID=A0A8A1LY75_AJECA|nr:hypothetical protein I7I51_08558 [Histoplasma capsulatum]
MVVLIPDPLFLRPTRELSGDASRMGYCTAKGVKGGYTLSVRRTVANLWCQGNPETLKQKRPLCPLHQDWDLRRLHRIVLLRTEATTKLARKTRPGHLLVPGTHRYNRSLTFVPRLWGEQILFYICGTIGSVKEGIFSENALQGLVTYHKNGGYLPHGKKNTGNKRSTKNAKITIKSKPWIDSAVCS